ncbi:adrenodoxin-like protein 2, mitochondrial isoform X6 [Cynara cardunculus var. scolymus]|uniref:adrenodoxin-like protein 2, mitochondrial isoform X6 n=1 Tax=Cynara cardunculus var. scolymus TaxID=59895 RepID=UPI000D6268F9|nr:adrenodoxin-like protein 2, mitochondrial isoform X6 [Cynara cardunculus var. scolymus]
MLKVVWSLSGNTMFTCKTLQLGPQAIKGLSKVSRILKSTSPALITPRKSYVQNFCLPGRERFSTTATDNAEGGNEENQNISVTFVDKDGEEKKIKVPIGMSMLEAAHENDIELEGACEGSLACSTCHVIVMVCHCVQISSHSNSQRQTSKMMWSTTISLKTQQMRKMTC